MAYIDPDGLFNGDRFSLVSDGARLVWPYFWCASNTLGRIELNYFKVVARAFSRFKDPPSEEQFWFWVREFQEAYLLFVYEVDGTLWGQWDTSEKYLPRHKLAADLRTPAPNAKDYLDWRNHYVEEKKARSAAKYRIISNSVKVSETLRTSAHGEERRDVGEERRDVGEEKPSCPADAGQPPALKPSQPRLITEIDPTDRWIDQQHDSRFWAMYWNRSGKADSRRAFRKRVRALMAERKICIDEAIEFLCAAARKDRETWEPTEAWSWRANLHPATWLNGKRWEDELPPQARARADPWRQLTKGERAVMELYERQQRQQERRP